MTGSVLAEKEIEGFDGVVIARGDDRYDEARALWNGMIDKRPSVLLRCRSTADVVAAVGFVFGVAGPVWPQPLSKASTVPSASKDPVHLICFNNIASPFGQLPGW